MVRLAHFSDIHVTSPVLDWKRGDWFNKRYAAWFNFRWLGRRKRFLHCDEVMQAMVAEFRARQPDHLIFSGDATALGFESEFRRAATFLEVNDATTTPGLAVPGNHDYCTKEAEASGLFERYFEPWQTGERIENQRYPFAQKVGDEVWLIGVNSCTGNRWAWDAGGAVGPQQIERLRLLLQKLSPGVRILVTHYPITRINGKPEHQVRGLRDLKELIDVSVDGGVSLWLHGHRHQRYVWEQSPLAPFPTICIGSTTQTDCWSYGEYSIAGRQLSGSFRQYDATTKSFREAESITLELPMHRAVDKSVTIKPTA